MYEAVLIIMDWFGSKYNCIVIFFAHFTLLLLQKVLDIFQFWWIFEDCRVVAGTVEVFIVDWHKTVHRRLVLQQKISKLTHKVLLILVSLVVVETFSCYFLEHSLF